MKKVLLYIGSMQKGGAQRVMSVIADCLINMDCEVVLINDIIPVEGVPEYEINRNVRRNFLDNSSKPNFFLKNFHRIAKLRQTIILEKPDCILSFLGPTNIRMLISSIGLKVRKVVSVRNDPYREYGRGLKRWISRLVFLLSDFTVFQTRDASTYFSKSVRQKSVVIPNPVSDEFYQHDWSGKGQNIVAIGRLHSQKNYPLLIKAFAKISQQYKNTNLDIYGDGTLKENLKHLCKELGVSKRVNFHGTVSNIPEILENSKLFVMSSNYEGMPNALMEAMAVGVPVISTDCPCGGPKELTDAGKYGILTPCEDITKFADALNKMLSSSDTLNCYHKLAKQKASEYKANIIMSKWYDVLICN